jgi:D-3-phosphoglycerate dehydrogenase
MVTDDRFGSYSEEEAVMREIGARLEVLALSTEEEAISALSEADGILVNLFPLTARLISSLPRCRVISRYGVGYDNVDVAAATRKKIWVARVPDYCFEEASDQALALLLGCVRKVAFKDRKIREGRWNLHQEQRTHRVAGKILGLIGFGAVGRCLLRKTAGFGLERVCVYDPHVEHASIRETGAEPVMLETLLAESDFVSIHAPLTSETRGMIGPREVGLMKPTAILINTARGPIVQEAALAAALSEGRLGGAGIDVFEHEPLPPESPLRILDNVILSDHASWYSEESVVELKRKAARNVAAVLSGGRPVSPVNALE